MKNSLNLFKILIALVISSSIIFFLLSKIEYQSIYLLLKDASFAYIFLAWFIYLIGNVFKTLRFGFLFAGRKPEFSKLYLITSLYNFFTSIFPSGIGEISYPILMKKYDQQPIGKGAGSILLVRLYDFCFFLTMFLMSGVGILKFDYIIEYTVIFFILLISVVVLFNLNPLTAFFGPKLILVAKHINQNIYTKFKQLYVDASTFLTRKDNYKIHVRLLFFTLCVWTSSVIFFYYAFQAFSSPIPLFHAMFITSAINLTIILPIYTIGGFGVKEATLAGILIVSGLFDSESSISLGIMVRLVSFASVFVLLGAAFIIYKIRYLFSS